MDLTPEQQAAAEKIAAEHRSRLKQILSTQRDEVEAAVAHVDQQQADTYRAGIAKM